MKAKLEIPKGWRRLKTGEVIKTGDRKLNVDSIYFHWMKMTADYLNLFPVKIQASRVDLGAVIRKVKK